MPLGLAYEGTFLLTMLASFLSVLLGGEMPLYAWGALVFPLACSRLHRKSFRFSPGFATFLGLGALGWGGFLLVQDGLSAIILTFAITIMMLLCARCMSRTQPTHDLQVMVLSFFLVISATVLHTQITFAPVFLLYVFVLIWSLTTWQLLHGRSMNAPQATPEEQNKYFHRTDIIKGKFAWATNGVVFGILFLSVTIFVLFPRIGLGQLSFLGRDSGQLPSEVNLTHSPRLTVANNDVVARIENVPFNVFEKGLYLRAQVYDSITLSGFERTEDVPQGTVSRNRWSRSGISHDYEVFMYPVVKGQLATLGPAVQAYIVSGGNGNPASTEIRIRGLGPSGELLPSEQLRGPIRYQVSGPVMLPYALLQNKIASSKKIKAERDVVLSYYQQYPEDIPKEIVTLSRRLVGAAKAPSDKARLLRNYLYQNYDYSLDPPPKASQGQFYSFLFEDAKGHCEYFAATFALMLRIVGVPARVVGGYQGGFWDSIEEMSVFTGKNAHVWVEWYHPYLGWVIDDATPVVYRSAERLEGFTAIRERLRLYWDDYVVEYALGNQMALLGATLSGTSNLSETWIKMENKGAFISGVLMIPGALLILYLLFVWRKIRRGRQDRAVARLEIILKRLLPERDVSVLSYDEALCLVAWKDMTDGEALRRQIHNLCEEIREARFAGVKVSETHWLQLEKNAKQTLHHVKRVC
ncbi:MAG: hypothetical protein CMH56_11830 [Myxococcales bacterium]|nr:hypothetical protein [Myxococcales bacterium]|tara:strand:- start:317 stop:2398 length:2082 start_codon:yes stop_codon:yes gene_type:complete